MKMNLRNAIPHAAKLVAGVVQTEQDAAAYDALCTANLTDLRVIPADVITAMREVLDDACQLQRAEKFCAPTRSSQIVEEWLAQQDAWGYGGFESKLYSRFLGWCVAVVLVASCVSGLFLVGGVK